MTRDEFVVLYGDFDIGDSETGEQAGASAKFARDLDSLLAAARAEALEEAAKVCDAVQTKATADADSSCALGWFGAEARDRAVSAGASRCCNAIRALVKP